MGRGASSRNPGRESGRVRRPLPGAHGPRGSQTISTYPHAGTVGDGRCRPYDLTARCRSWSMAKRTKVWVRVRVLPAEEKAAIAAICERFIAETLKPRFLPEIRPTQFNYPVDIFGQWRGSKYSFVL